MKNLQPYFTAGIFLIAFLSLLVVAFNTLLEPLRGDIKNIDTRMDRIETRMDRMETSLKADLKSVNNKIDALILSLSKDTQANNQ